MLAVHCTRACKPAGRHHSAPLVIVETKSIFSINIDSFTYVYIKLTAAVCVLATREPCWAKQELPAGFLTSATSPPLHSWKRDVNVDGCGVRVEKIILRKHWTSLYHDNHFNSVVRKTQPERKPEWQETIQTCQSHSSHSDETKLEGQELWPERKCYHIWINQCKYLILFVVM